MYMCVPVVSNWDRHGAPAGNWARASVSHLALETDLWLQALPWLCQKLGQSWFSLQKRTWETRFLFFLRLFFAVLGNIVVRGWKDSRQKGRQWPRDLDSNSQRPWRRKERALSLVLGLRTYSVIHGTFCVNSWYTNAIFKAKFKRLLREGSALCCSTDKAGLFEFSLAKSHKKKKKSNFQRGDIAGVQTLIWVVSRKTWPVLTTWPFSPDALTNSGRTVRKVLPKGTSAGRGEFEDAVIISFWWSHRRLRGLWLDKMPSLAFCLFKTLRLQTSNWLHFKGSVQTVTPSVCQSVCQLVHHLVNIMILCGPLRSLCPLVISPGFLIHSFMSSACSFFYFLRGGGSDWIVRALSFPL